MFHGMHIQASVTVVLYRNLAVVLHSLCFSVKDPKILQTSNLVFKTTTIRRATRSSTLTQEEDGRRRVKKIASMRNLISSRTYSEKRPARSLLNSNTGTLALQPLLKGCTTRKIKTLARGWLIFHFFID
jgi:hypothetical protein